MKGYFDRRKPLGPPLAVIPERWVPREAHDMPDEVGHVADHECWCHPELKTDGSWRHRGTAERAS